MTRMTHQLIINFGGEARRDAVPVAKSIRMPDNTKLAPGEAPDAEIQNPKAGLASLDASPNMKFEREEWTSFRTLEGLSQKVGVAKGKLSRLVASTAPNWSESSAL